MEKKTHQSCDWNDRSKQPDRSSDKNRIYSHKGELSWKGVRTEKYKDTDGGWSSILRRVLIGNKGEHTRFHVRYFEISPGGFSSFERHLHAHVVIVVKGKGTVRMGKRTRTVGFMDTVYIKGLTPHQLSNPFREDFGFLCIVDAKRDKPELLE